MAIYYSNTFQGFYDTEVVQYLSLPDDVIEISSIMRDNLISELNTNNKSIVLNSNNEITLIEKIISWDEIRGVRTMFLVESDYTQLPDFPEAKKQEWATYRQLLRDIPQTYSNPQDVIWPTKPEN